MNILGVSAYFHDSAACLIRDGEIVAAAQEEVFTRRKHDQSFPAQAAKWCLQSAGIDWTDIDWFAYYELPLLKMRRVLASAAATGEQDLIRDTDLWAQLNTSSRRDVGAMFPPGQRHGRVLAVEHHLSHAASAFFPSPFDEAAVVTIDGVGEYTTTSVSLGKGHTLTPLRRQAFPHSLGLFYSAFTHYCGFRVNSGEYKLMGLAPYGTPRFSPLIEDRIIRISQDGSFRLNMGYFDFLAPSSQQLSTDRLEELLGRPRRSEEADIDEFYADVAASAQATFEKAVVRIARHARSLTGARNLCLAGGGALNCVANSKIQVESGFEGVWVQPAASDAGGSLGAASYVWHQRLSNPRCPEGNDAMQGSLLGPSFDNGTIRSYLDSIGARYSQVDHEELVRTAAELLAAGKIVAWFQGRQEFGPRALGSRSILGDPRSPGLQRHLNLAVKNRESFRPFAPAVPLEDAKDYFEPPTDSPYMLFVAPVRKNLRVPASSTDSGMRPEERVGQVRSVLPAITHIDHSARLQTVDRETHPLFWNLLRVFGCITGTPVLVNTSFNVRGEPIVCTPEDAVKTFLRTEIDYLCLGDNILDRREQSAVNITIPPVADLD
ncbi:carbamoyltransferase [Streptomyces sp. 2314.4]|uniref:carbamoyltransferase family protein n=1 Tax=Streptomyces sp. 2314.4 TaxID=1881025 RepID=UPI00089DA267|nr:carbamoyltransferase [Streptomyces sp. 2314.4]SEC16316.1 carbamoyltransferase [Streptomyces sp. 2314.4]